MFNSPLEHLAAELQRLDLLIHREILRLRARYQLSLDEFRGLYISDEHVDRLIDQTLGREQPTTVVQELTERAATLRQSNAEQRGTALPWRRIIDEFHLSSFEQEVLLLALAPEVDLKYETLYAYLNNDVTRKWPTRDLALRLFAETPVQHLSLRQNLQPQATLFRDGLLQSLVATPDRLSWLASGFALTASLSRFLLGSRALGSDVDGYVEQREPTVAWEEAPIADSLKEELQQVVRRWRETLDARAMPMLIFTGLPGTGRERAAAAICGALGTPLLRVNLETARASAEPLRKLLHTVALQQRLLGAGVYLARGESLFDKEGQAFPEAKAAMSLLLQMKGPLFFSCSPHTPWQDLFRGGRRLLFRFETPDYARRRQTWAAALSGDGGLTTAEVDALADRFVLTPGQIEAAAATADAQRWLRNNSSASLSLDLLTEAARAQSSQSLGNLAVKVSTVHAWEDLVLPAATRKRVQEITAAITRRHVVYSQWGFERRIASGRGLKVLFAGASGTGKTMTASVMAKEVGLDLYKIDLAGVVSKYIGETEKNLERIFRAAHSSNAILFFDEADALFGKRSEVKDAHDRYANIEVAYLLQRMEEHDGVVILATNLSKNIDEAFSRRMHYVVEFPLPDEAHRERLWRGMFPPEAPLGKDVDFAFLAKQFSIAGGDIRNVALDAAFLAAQDGQVIAMKQLILAMARQLMKQGRIPSSTEFKQYHALISRDA